MDADPERTYELRIVLDDTDPPVWRTFTVPAEIGLDELHYVLQVVMGWTNSHLHEFRMRSRRFGDLEDEFMDEDILPEGEYCLDELLTRRKQTLTYDYDFGDGWRHTITLIGIRDEPCAFPVCTGGERACPVEDCGGIPGHEHLVEVLADPEHEEYADLSRWLGWMRPDGFDPAVFPIEAINEQLAMGVDAVVQAALEAEEAAYAEWEAESEDDGPIPFPGV